MGGSPTRHWKVTTEKSQDGNTWATIAPVGFTRSGLGRDRDPAEAIAKAMRDFAVRLGHHADTEAG